MRLEISAGVATVDFVHAHDHVARLHPGFFRRRTLGDGPHQHAFLHAEILRQLSVERFRFDAQHRASPGHESCAEYPACAFRTAGGAASAAGMLPCRMRPACARRSSPPRFAARQRARCRASPRGPAASPAPAARTVPCLPRAGRCMLEHHVADLQPGFFGGTVRLNPRDLHAVFLAQLQRLRAIAVDFLHHHADDSSTRRSKLHPGRLTVCPGSVTHPIAKTKIAVLITNPSTSISDVNDSAAAVLMVISGPPPLIDPSYTSCGRG